MKKFKTNFLCLVVAAFLMTLGENLFSVKLGPLIKTIIVGGAWAIGDKIRKEKEKTNTNDKKNSEEQKS